MIRKASETDISSIVKIYDALHDSEESGATSIGWIRGVYPTEKTANDALKNKTLFVLEDGGKIVASAKIDKNQVLEYKNAKWEYDADDDEVMVLHTLVVDPNSPRKGYGKAFVEFYEQYARENGCRFLRIDTNEKNTAARAMYKKLGYKEADIVPCNFNGISGVSLVCLEKKV